MTCRSCGANIAEKAIVCYRCGAPTAEPVERRPARRTRSLVPLVVAVIAAAAAIVVWLVTRTS